MTPALPSNMDKTPSLFTPPQPLAARLRPRSLKEFVGQEHLVGPGRLLWRALKAKRLFSSMIFWGPPGSGKTTLARALARVMDAQFASLSAVMSGVPDLRKVVEEARRWQEQGRRTILLIDEIHRFNKAQQDALLPHVEEGLLTLIGATTENPYFEIIGPLLSRARIFVFEPLTEANLLTLLRRALTDKDQGLGNMPVEVAAEALAHFARMASGDARRARPPWNWRSSSTEPDAQGVIRVDLAAARECMPRRDLIYDKQGDAHYDTVSAFIKSIRGSDPDAALYWLARMLEAGEDPRFIMRRLLILASEDIGLADPTPWCRWPRPLRPSPGWACPRAGTTWPRPPFTWPWPPRATPPRPISGLRKPWRTEAPPRCPRPCKTLTGTSRVWAMARITSIPTIFPAIG